MEAPGKPQFQGGIPTQRMSGNNPVTSAIGNVGRSISNLGSLALELQKEQEHQYKNEAEQKLTKAASEINEMLIKNRYSPDEHVQKAREKFQSVRAGMLNSGKYSPAFQKEIEQRTQLFIDGKLDQIGTNALLMQVENGRKLQNANTENDIVEGRYDSGRARVKEGIGRYHSKEDAEIKIMGINRRERDDDYRMKQEAGDVEFFEQEGLSLADSDRQRMKNAAESSRARMESQEVDQIAGAQAIGSINTKEDLARNLEGAVNIKPETAKRILSNWDKNTPLTFEEKSGITDKLNNLHGELTSGKITPEEYSKKHHELASEVFAFGRRDGTGGLRTRVHQLDPANWRPGNLTSGEDEDKGRKVEEMAATWDRAGGFGKPRKGEDALTPSQALDAQSARELTEMAVKEWLKTDEGEKATPDQIKREFMKEAMRSNIEADVRDFESDPVGDLKDILGLDENFEEIEVSKTILPKN